jgi:hypothetical protein
MRGGRDRSIVDSRARYRGGRIATGSDGIAVSPQTDATITRRLVLLAVMLPLAGCIADRAGPEVERNLATWLRCIPPGPRTAAVIGTLYLRDAPGERSAAWLAHHLFGAELSQPFAAAEFQARLRFVIERRHRDFVDDDLVLLEGWAVPRTEARLLSLIALCGAS